MIISKIISKFHASYEKYKKSVIVGYKGKRAFLQKKKEKILIIKNVNS